jgi:hypothetical protein
MLASASSNTPRPSGWAIRRRWLFPMARALSARQRLEITTATQDTVTQLMAAIRKVARIVPGAAEVTAAVCKLDYSRPGKPAIGWDDPAAKEQLVSDLANDALAVQAELAGPGAPEREAAEADALGAAGPGRRAGRRAGPAQRRDRRVVADRPQSRPGPISTVGPQARHTRESKSKRRDGFRGHVAAEPETGLITGCEMPMAAGEAAATRRTG